MTQNICIHRYLTKCKTNPQPPGFADFIRGTMTLFLLSKRYNYKLLLDYNSHPFFKNLEFNKEYFIMNTENSDTLEFLPPKSYNNIFNNIENLFKQNNPIIYIHTNSCYNSFGVVSNFTDYEINNAKKFIIDLLKPNAEVLEIYRNKFNNITSNQYIVLHIRFEDKCFFQSNFNIPDSKVHTIIGFIKNLSHTENKQIIIISNWKKYINNDTFTDFKNIYVTDSEPIHTGSLIQKCNDTELKSFLQNTLIDLLLLTNSSKNYCISRYGYSGFSEVFSNIHNIPYINMSSLIKN